MQYMVRTTGEGSATNSIWDWSAKGRAITRSPGLLNQHDLAFWATVRELLTRAQGVLK